MPGALRTYVRVKVPATTANLGSGCDCLSLALNLYNTVTVGLSGAGLVISVHGEGKGQIPEDGSNLVWQAVKRLWGKCGFPVPPGVMITLENGIPVAAGLGSSAAAIIGGLTAANIIAGDRFSAHEILTLATALEGHPDNITAAFFGGLTVVVAEENGLKWLKIPVDPGLQAVAAVPDFQISTKDARIALPQSYRREDALYNVGRAALLVGAFASKRYELLSSAMQDRLYQPYRASLVPGLGRVVEAAVKAGAFGAALSGAGPAVVAIAGGNTDAIGAAMMEAFRGAGINARVFTLAADNHGAGE
ncbi:MAG: homoserine kinase [Bacillota bacterium]